MLSQNTINSVKNLNERNRHFLNGVTTYAKCYKVIDGDTIKVNFYLAENFPVSYSVRLLGINTPERKQANYDEATKRTKELVEGKVVKLLMSKFDAFGRILSKVYTIDSGECVNDILLLEDLATIY